MLWGGDGPVPPQVKPCSGATCSIGIAGRTAGNDNTDAVKVSRRLIFFTLNT